MLGNGAGLVIGLRPLHPGADVRTPQAKWLSIQYALYVGCSLFGVAYYYVFGTAEHLGGVAVVAGAGRLLAG